MSRKRCAHRRLDHPSHPRSLIRVFEGRSMRSQGSSVSSGGKLRLWSKCADVLTDFEASLIAHASFESPVRSQLILEQQNPHINMLIRGFVTSKQIKSGHHQPTSETPFFSRINGDPRL